MRGDFGPSENLRESEEVLVEKSSNNLLVYDRAAGTVIEEKVPAKGLLLFLYSSSAGGVFAALLGGLPFFSKLVGFLHRSKISVGAVKRAIRNWNIEMKEFFVPPEGFRCFDDFFTRRLRQGARPIDEDPRHVISPCDSRLFAVPEVAQEGRFRVKGCWVSLRELLCDRGLAERYRGGTALVYRLAPADYHWFHFPEDGLPGPVAHLPGTLHSVNPLAFSKGRRILQINKRDRTVLETEKGAVCMVEVGAMCFGSIVQTFVPGRKVKRGQEKGYFRFGGSTVIVLYGAGQIEVDQDILKSSEEGFETLVKMGEKVGRYTV